jgi:hypothetical protein
MCKGCGAPIPARPGRGRPRLYCSPACKYRAHRAQEIAAARRWNATHRERFNANNRRWRDAHLDQQRERGRRKAQDHPEAGMWWRHGLRPEGWWAIWDAQAGRCYLCEEPLSEQGGYLVVVEHDHRCCPQERSCSQCRRGLACHRCNVLIGLARDDPQLLRRIAANLSAAKRRLGPLPKPRPLFDL